MPARSMERYRGQLAAAVRAVAFDRGGRLLWQGTPRRSVSPRIWAALSPEDRRKVTSLLLGETLYERFYCHGGVPGDSYGSGSYVERGVAAAFASELSSANAGTGSSEAGWRILGRDGDAVTVERAGLALRATLADASLNPGADPSPGSPVALRLASELPKVSPGYYVALGNEAWPDAGDPLVRVYWNLMPAGAIRLIRAATERLNDARIAFRIKALDDPAAYTRCDAAVLYFLKADADAVTSILVGIYRDLRPYLKAPIPAFTKELAPGLGLAEDPATGDSFGMARCECVAEGLLLSRGAGMKSLSARLDIVEAHLRREGVDPRKPYLNPGSVDRYDFPPASPYIGVPWRQDGETGGDLFPAELLLAASRIGERLAACAIRVGDRAGWVGLDPIPHRGAVGHEARHSALGPDLYAGTSGIALFLAELSAATGDPKTRTLALAAAQQALACAETDAGAVRAGLFDGWSGVALVAARVGRLLGDPAALSRAKALARRRTSREVPCDPFDLISGKAGLMLALVILSDLLDDARLRIPAVRFGDLLLDTSTCDAGARSWRDPRAKARRNPTGLAHGASGAAYALLELFHATGEARFRECADAALAYERRWLHSRGGKGPDSRGETASAGPRGHPFRLSSSWCRGAGGIALSRMRAWELLGTVAYEDEARRAIATTRREAERVLTTGCGDLSLCHGLAGDSEVLLSGSRFAAPAVASEDRRLAHRLAAAMIQRLGLLGEGTPSVVPELPLGLMSGLAGAGHLFLRLRDARVPSVLSLRAEECSAPGYLARGSNPSASQTSG